MKLSKIQTGFLGEEEALKFLLNKGYKIIERNFRCFLGELDFILSDREELVFLEVKARRSKSFGEPFEAVDIRKQRKLYRLAEYYLSSKRLDNISCRFDVISVILSSKGNLKKLEHIENAFGV